MNRFVGLLGVVVVGFSVACTSSDAVQPLGAPVDMVRLRSEQYSFSYHSGIDKPARIVVRDAATWRDVWTQIHLRLSPTPSLPTVDFSREMIVVAALGSRSTGGYSILLDRASGSGADGTVIMVRSVSPGPRCATTLAFTQPVDVARLPVRTGAVQFVEESDVSQCGD